MASAMKPALPAAPRPVRIGARGLLTSEFPDSIFR